MKIICIGRNYESHITELNNERPKEPVVFMKPDTSILLNGSTFYIPDFSNDVHYEVEILVKISKVGKYIDAKFAHKYYDQVGLGIDFTARDLQSKLKSKGLPWELAKSFDGSAIIGDFIPKNAFLNLENIKFGLKKNGERVQTGSTKEMIWKIDEIISYVSQFFTLKTGDIIFTGTPDGVGKIESGDLLEGFIEDKKVLNLHIK